MGSYGVVTKVKDKKTGETYALKSIPKLPPNKREKNSPRSYINKLISEVKVMQHVAPSLNVVYLYDVFEDATHIHLLMEYCRGGELWKRIRTGKYSEAYAASIMRSILQVLAQCHAKNVIYRDVKPDNFLFLTTDDDSPLKATDFGLATYFVPGETLTRRCGTPSYLAPEVVNRAYGPEADCWSAGVTAYQLLSGHLPFRDSRRATIKEVLKAVVEDPIILDDDFWTKQISDSARDFTSRLLDRDPKTRLTAAQALDHPWVKRGGTASTDPLCGSAVQRLQRFGTFPVLKRQVLRFMAPIMLQEDSKLAGVVQTKELFETFKKFDHGVDGHLHVSDLKEGLDEAGYIVTLDEVKQLVHAVDMDRNGDMSYQEFLATMIDWNKVEEYDPMHFSSLVNRAFDELDEEKLGVIGKHSIERMLCDEDCSAEACSLMVSRCMEEADKDGDGAITREEFYEIVHTENDDVLGRYDNRHHDIITKYDTLDSADWSASEYDPELTKTAKAPKSPAT
mmetsp:Transcript_1526/g.2178  ORF Transcript_1526/g.2178 Transcript_1526/m.2178 type:complete len:508 (+) Transcript_1526:250-1773(+)